MHIQPHTHTAKVKAAPLVIIENISFDPENVLKSQKHQTFTLMAVLELQDFSCSQLLSFSELYYTTDTTN